MRSLDNDCSIRTARIASRTLRAMETSPLSNMFLATCCVMVDAPMGRRFWPYCCTSTHMARAMA